MSRPGWSVNWLVRDGRWVIRFVESHNSEFLQMVFRPIVFLKWYELFK